MAALRIAEIFANALECPTEAERQAYLDRACADAPEVRQRVEELLRAHPKNAVGFLDKPGPELLASLASDPDRTAQYDQANSTPGPSQSTPADPERTTPREFNPEGPMPAEKERIGEVINGYALVRKLGDGGMGTVYLGEKGDGKEVIRVAIKLIKPDRVSPHLVARFKAERRILTRLNHGNIAKVFDMGVHGPQALPEPYFIMEYVADKDSSGQTLDGYCSRNRLSIAERLALFEAVCRGVEHAHSSGVIHRDLKGLNILVAVPRNGQPVAKVIDFGLAKTLEEEVDGDPDLTSPGSFMGTPAYVSPEQASGEAGIGPRTDVYALGVILYKLLTGALPIDLAGVRGHFEMVERIRNVIPLHPSEMVRSRDESLAKVAEERRIEPARLPALLRGDLDWVTMKALEKKPEKRYATAGALADEIRRFLDGEPVEAGPDGFRPRLAKFYRRNRILVTAGSVVLLTLILGIIGLIVGIVQVDAAKNRETAARIQAEDAEEVERKALTISWAGIRTQIRSGEAIDEDRKLVLQNMAEGLRQLISEKPNASRKIRATHAETIFRLANLSTLLGLEDAEDLYTEAIRGYESLDAEFPGTQEYPNELARCHFDLAHLRMKTGRLADTIAEFRAAIELHERVVVAAPDEPAYRRELADAWNDLGVALKRAGKLPEAEQAFRNAIREGELALSRNADRPTYAIGLAMGSHNLGNVVRDRGDPKEAIEIYKKATALLRPLAGGGKSRDATKVLVDTCWDRANARGQLHLYDAALADWNAACQLNEIFKFYDGNMLALFRAAAQIEAKYKGQIPVAEAYPAAKLNAQAARAAIQADEPTLQKQYEKRALELLIEAKSAGFFRDPKNLAAFQSDPDFADLPKDSLAAFRSGLTAPPPPKK